MFCKFEMDVFRIHVIDIVFDLSTYENFVLEFPLRSPMNTLSKTHRALRVFQLSIHGGSAPDSTQAGRYTRRPPIPQLTGNNLINFA